MRLTNKQFCNRLPSLKYISVIGVHLIYCAISLTRCFGLLRLKYICNFWCGRFTALTKVIWLVSFLTDGWTCWSDLCVLWSPYNKLYLSSVCVFVNFLFLRKLLNFSFNSGSLLLTLFKSPCCS